MTPYQSAAKLAMETFNITTRDQVKVVTWLPFQLLYVEMVKAKEIPALRELPEEERRKYETEAQEAQPGKPLWKQMWIRQALYMFDLINENNNQ